jgi:hypothetical protein
MTRRKTKEILNDKKKNKRDIKWQEEKQKRYKMTRRKTKEILNDKKKNKRDIKWPEEKQKRY